MTRSARDILEERAQALAEPVKDEAKQALPVTVFARAGQQYGVRMEEVEGAGRLRDLSTVPGAPGHIVGALQHRGEVVVLLDLPRLWGEGDRGVQDLPTYMVLSDGRQRVGILVEDLRGVHELDGAPVPYQGVERSGVVEVAHLRGEPMLILSAKVLLQDPRLT